MSIFVGSFSVTFILIITLFFPVFNKQSGLDLIQDFMSTRFDAGLKTGDIGKEPSPVDDMPYVYVAPNRMGAFGKYVVNVPYYRNWLNNTVSWKVEKSSDGAKWSDYKKFSVKKDWNPVNLSEKHTVVVDADTEAYYRILTNTRSDRELVSFEDKSSVTLYELNFKVSEDRSYTLLYNWSDYSKSPEASKTSMTKSVKTESTSSKQYFEWMITSSVKLHAGEQFVLDPVYGTIGNAVISSYEYEATQGKKPAIIRLNDSEYYLIAVTDTNNDGLALTLRIWDSNGTIQQSIISSYIFDSGNEYGCDITQITGTDKYAIAYHETGVSVNVVTLQVWDNNGTIRPSVIDTQALTYGATASNSLKIINVVNNVYAIIYTKATQLYGIIDTITINNDGTIDDALLDMETFDNPPLYGLNTRMGAIMIDSDTILISADMNNDQGCLLTYNISNAGLITNTKDDYWLFDAAGAETICMPSIYRVSGNIFAVAHTYTDNDGYIHTIQVNDDGNIVGTTWIDTLEFADSNTVRYSNLFCVNDASSIPGGVGVYGITFQDANGDGQVYTINISSDGTIADSVNDMLKFDAADSIWIANVVHCSGNYYAIAYEGTGNDGWACTITIETYEAPWSNTCPTESGIKPVNQSTGVAVSPRCYGVVNDVDTNQTITATFASNCTGSWVNYQHNSSVALGTNVSWLFTGASGGSTRYWWRLYAFDGICNTSKTYYFTTVSTWSNTCPTGTGIKPTNGSAGIALKPKVYSIVNDTDVNQTLTVTFASNHSGSWVNYQHNNSVALGSNVSWYFDKANTGSTKYYWRTYIFDGICNVSKTYSFTTSANATIRSSTQIFDYYFLCGNTTGRVSTNIFDYFFSCSNTSHRESTQIFDSWFQCGNMTSRTSTEIFDLWYFCSNETHRTSTQVFDKWFLCGNETSRTSTSIFDYWLQCGNTTGRTSVEIFNYWFSCSNTSSRVPTNIFDYYFVCGNETTRTSTEVFDFYFQCGNTTTRNLTTIFDYYFVCGNMSSRASTNIFDYYFLCGNTSSRLPTQIFDYWFMCGNETIRTPSVIFDYWFLCGNETYRNPVLSFDYYFLCGNTTTRSSINIFDYWFLCGNTTIPDHIILSNPIPIANITISIDQNNISGHMGDIQVSITRNHTTGVSMNTSIWFNNTLLFTNISWGNGTIAFWLFDYYAGMIHPDTNYTWVVNCSSGLVYVNETYGFKMNISGIGVSGFVLFPYGNTFVFGLVLGVIVIAPMVMFWWHRRKKKE